MPLSDKRVPETEVPLTHPLGSYLTKHFSGKASIAVDDNDTRCVCLNHAENRQEWHTKLSDDNTLSLLPHQCLVYPSKWELRQELEWIHSVNTQVTLHELQNSIKVLCVQVRGIHMYITWQSHDSTKCHTLSMIRRGQCVFLHIKSASVRYYSTEHTSELASHVVAVWIYYT